MSAFGLGLDVKLALRLLVKYPLLSSVGGIGMACGLAAGVVGLEVRGQMINPRLPLEDGDRIVGFRNWDLRRDVPMPVSEADFHTWRGQLQTVEGLGAVALVEHNLTVNGNVEPVSVAEMTASGFRIARVAPALGRTLVDSDESPSAPPVAVIGSSLWQRRFLGDPRIVGRSVRLGMEQTTIVGVMPEGFGFPAAHQVWVPLRLQPLRQAAEAKPLLVFGRLAKGATFREAQAEFTTVGRRIAADVPDAYESLRPEVVPYAELLFDARNLSVGLALANVFLVMLVLVVSTNVALLMFARAASREREIGVRHALGASRSRIVAQLFVEGVVLAGLSASVGLAAARYGLGSLWRLFEADSGRPLPFWMTDSLTPSTIAYGVGLTMLVAVIIGVFPALKVTGHGLLAQVRQHTGGGGYRFGGVWTAVIAVQVAVTVMFPAAAFFFHRWVVAGQTRDVGFPAEQYLSARLEADGPPNFDELRRQLSAEPGVAAVTFAEPLPGMSHPSARFEVEGDTASQTFGHQVWTASVDADFFDALGAPVLSGREFTLTDLASTGEVAVVNTSFVQRVLGGGNAVGRRIRQVPPEGQTPGPWIEIVGIARDLGIAGAEGVGLYRPLHRQAVRVHVALHVRGAPESLADRLHAVANRVDPVLRVHDVMRLDEVGADGWLESRYMSRLLTVLSGIALLLSLSAIYAVMAFTVVQRTREIGTRVALGADRLRIVTAIARQPLTQIALGIGVGGVLVVLTFIGLLENVPTPLEVGLIAAYAIVMLAVCLSACVVPTRRALRLQPSEVLRADA